MIREDDSIVQDKTLGKPEDSEVGEFSAEAGGAPRQMNIDRYAVEFTRLIGEEKDLSKIGVDTEGASFSIRFNSEYDGPENDPESVVRYLARVFVLAETVGVINIDTPEDIIALVNGSMKIKSFEQQETDWQKAILRTGFSISAQTESPDEQADESDEAPDKGSPDGQADESDEAPDEGSPGEQADESPDGKERPGHDPEAIWEALGVDPKDPSVQVLRKMFNEAMKEYTPLTQAYLINELCWGREENIQILVEQYFPSNGKFAEVGEKILKLFAEKTRPFRTKGEELLEKIIEDGIAIERATEKETADERLSNLRENTNTLNGVNFMMGMALTTLLDRKSIEPPTYRTKDGINARILEIYQDKGWQLDTAKEPEEFLVSEGVATIIAELPGDLKVEDLQRLVDVVDKTDLDIQKRAAVELVKMSQDTKVVDIDLVELGFAKDAAEIIVDLFGDVKAVDLYKLITKVEVAVELGKLPKKTKIGRINKLS